jgi:phage terminase large subunit
MTADQFAQEYECSWVANVPGSIYGKEVQTALEEKRICNVPYDPSSRVDTFWDLGIGDSTAIVLPRVLVGLFMLLIVMKIEMKVCRIT